ncbi:bifunctional oligoribonuclease/PAP phosphatase NrnA [bacterium]|nr:bifunctional oligoribonuclease/PAP phosphatase NrnA [bacterium]
MKDALEILRQGSRFLVTTHDFPDGDGLGSQMALHLGLLSIGKQSYAINPGPTPEKFQLVDPKHAIQIYQPGKPLPNVDAIVVVDTSEMTLLGPMEKAIQASGAPIVFVDHHTLEKSPGGAHFVREEYAATGELVHALLSGLRVTLDEAMATALYVAIVTDTAGFRFKRTSPRSHRIAAQLLECGVQPETVYHTIFARESAHKLRLLGHALERLELSTDGKIAWVTVPRQAREKFGATVEDTESFVGALTLLRGVEIAALFREEDDGRTKISLRGLGARPVLEIARSIGGGGHKFAAGARVSQPMPQVVQQVLAACAKVLAVKP